RRLDLDRAVKMADASLKWRAQARMHELSEANIPEACLSAGFAYPMNLDRYGNHVLLLRLSKTGRLPLQDVRRLLIFMVESLLRKQNASRITLLVDCAAADRRQLDLARFLTAIFRCYYPRWDSRPMEHNESEVQMWKGQECILSSSVYLLSGGAVPCLHGSARKHFRKLLPTWMGGTDSYQYVYTPGQPLGDRCPRLQPLDPGSSPSANLQVYGMFTA
ncbi:nuclear distribution protein NUDC, putative, partial [Ixodes scapularis]